MLKQLNKVLIGLIFVMSFFNVQAATNAKRIQSMPSYNTPSKPIIVEGKQGQFTLTLKSTPSTGYSWFLTYYNSAVLAPVKHRYIAPQSSMPGAAGYEVWYFNINDGATRVPQITYVDLVYARPWVIGGGQPERFVVVIK